MKKYYLIIILLFEVNLLFSQTTFQNSNNNTFSYNPALGCMGFSFVNFQPLLYNSNYINYYSWDFGNGQFSFGTDPGPQTQFYSQPGQYNVSLHTQIYNYTLSNVSINGIANTLWCGDIEEPSLPGNCQGLPDPYFVYNNGNSSFSYESNFVNNSLSASWNNVNHTLESTTFTLTFWDYDTQSNDDQIGIIQIDITGLSPGQYSFSSNEGISGTFTFTASIVQDFYDTGVVSVGNTPLTPSILINNQSFTSISICQGQQITLSSSTQADGYLWSNGATTQSITVSPNQTTSYFVRANNGSCYSDTSQHLTITVLPPPPTPTITPSGSLSICAGEEITLTSSFAENYFWSNGYGNTQSITVSPLQTTTYYLSVYNNFDGFSFCTSNQDSVVVSVISQPISICGSTYTSPSQTYLYEVISNNNSIDYQWGCTGCNIQNGQGTNSVNVTWNNGNNNFIWVAENNGGCNTYDTLFVSSPTNNPSAPNPVYNNYPPGVYPAVLNNLIPDGSPYFSQLDIITITDTCAFNTFLGTTICSPIKATRVLSTSGLPTGLTLSPNYNGNIGGYDAWINCGDEPNFSSYHGSMAIIGTQPSILQSIAPGVYDIDISLCYYYRLQINNGIIGDLGYLWSNSTDFSGVGIGTLFIDTLHYQLIVENCSYGLYPELCLVTVDPTTGYNQLIWEENTSFSYYKLYKQNSITSQYDSIYSLPIDSVSIYTDLASNPSQQSSSYAISAVDTCGVEKSISLPHKTIHLSANQGVNGEVNLLWNAYEGFSYSNFEIYRSNNGSGFTLIGNVANNSYSYTDLTPPIGTNYYYVAVTSPGCSPTKSITKANSNLLDSQGNSVILGENEIIKNVQFLVFPNPANENISISLNKPSNNVAIEIYDMYGKLVMTEVNKSGKQFDLNISTIASGAYCIKLTVAGVQSRAMFIKN